MMDGQELEVRLRSAVTMQAFSGVDHGVSVKMGTRCVGMPESELRERLDDANASLARAQTW